MLVDIDKIVVGDRIRKDFGDIKELADDIKQNTLLNALVVTPNGDGTYLLIAGERRLRACKLLGYNAVPVNTVGVDDAEQALMMEISENECRKEFTKTERLAYARQLARIETAKAKERQGTRTDMVENSPLSAESGKTRDIVADKLGTSSNTIARDQYIEDHRDLLDPVDFADWDEGKLSTNKAYQKVKEAQRQAEDALRRAERERNLAERERDMARENLADAYKNNESLEAENSSLRQQLSEKPKPEVIEHEVVREVKPPDYDETKRRNEALARENERLNSEYHKMWEEKREADMRLQQANELLGERERNSGANRDVEQLVNNIYTLLNRHGGKSRAFDQFYRVDETTQQECRKALVALGGFAQSLLAMTEETNRLGA